MNESEKFLETFNELEDAGKKAFNLPEDGKTIFRLEGMPEFVHEKTKLGYCRQVRNLLVHQGKFEKEFLVSPSKQMIDLLRQLINKVNEVPLCEDYAIPTANIYSCTIDDFVLPAMNTMKEHNYTHIPLLDSGIVIGVFSENTLFSYALDNKHVNIDRETKFRDLGKYLPINKHLTENFRFLSWKSRVFEAKMLFEDALKSMERIGMVFLTENGKETEELMGILTPWDILGNQILI